MQLTKPEREFLTALAREQAQTGCRGPAHDLLRLHVYREAPNTGRDSLAFSYAAVPLIGLLLRDHRDLQELDDFLRDGELSLRPAWPWQSEKEYRSRLDEAKSETAQTSLDQNQTRPQLAPA